METEHHDTPPTSADPAHDLLQDISLNELFTRAEKLRDGEMLLVTNFSVGSKQLELSIRKGGFFVGYVKTTDMPRVEGETTQMYAVAKAYLQRVADSAQQPVKYVFATLNESMKRWALTTGRQLWNWDVVRDTGFTFTAEATITPADKRVLT